MNMMDDERSLRKLASRLVEQVSSLTGLICSMEEQTRALKVDNNILRQHVADLAHGICPPNMTKSVLEEPEFKKTSNEFTFDEATTTAPIQLASAPESSSYEDIFFSSSVKSDNDPMIYEVEPGYSQQEDFDEMFEALKPSSSEVEIASPNDSLQISPIPRLNRRFNRRASGPLRILAVEDDPFCQQLIRHIVNSLNIGHIEVVADGVDAVINMSTGSFDLILMDMQLPRLDGLQATQSIRKFNRRTPIVSMTGQLAADDLRRYFEGGIDEILPKPFDRQAVMRVIEHFFKLTIA